VIRGGDWPSTVPAQAEFQCRLGFFPGVPFDEVRRRVVDCVSKAASADAWLKENPPTVEFFGFRSEGHSVERNQPAFDLLSECHRTLSGRPSDSFTATCTTDLRSFVHFGTGQATCFGPVAERIHGANERVSIESVIHTAKVYALFLARWCGTVE
jgi:acetylornithine deacetylase